MVHMLSGRMLNALKSIAVSPGGLRLSAHPSSMPKLMAMGLVEERPVRPRSKKTGWFLTTAGREVISQHRVDDL